MKNVIFLSENFQFLEVNRRVFVMFLFLYKNIYGTFNEYPQHYVSIEK